MFDIACIGILVADVITKPVEKMPESGKLERVDSIEIYSGGCAMSAGIDMQKIGLKTAVLGKVGKDKFGEFLLGELKRYNVDCDGIVIDEKTQTSASVVISSSSGERSFLHCPGANNTYCMDDVNWDIIHKSKIVFIAGAMLMDSFDGEPCAKVLKKVKELGKITVLDLAWDSKGRWMNIIKPCLPYVDVFMPSIDEARELSGKTGVKEMADVFFENGAKQVVIKDGKNGCYLRESKQADGIIIPTYDVLAVDTTGAGDSFCAGFITGMSKNMSFTECGKFANAVGSHCVMEKGATTGIKSFEEIKKFMEAKI